MEKITQPTKDTSEQKPADLKEIETMAKKQPHKRVVLHVDGVELPHQESDLKPDEIIESEQEPLDNLKTEREEIGDIIEEDIDEVSLPGVYTKGELLLRKASHGDENLTAHESSMANPAKAPPAAPKIPVKEPTPAPIKPVPPQGAVKPQPLVLTRQKAESRERFSAPSRKMSDNSREHTNQERREQVKENLKKIITFAREYSQIDNEDVKRITGLSESQARTYLDILEKRGKLVQFSTRGPKAFYKPAKKL